MASAPRRLTRTAPKLSVFESLQAAQQRARETRQESEAARMRARQAQQTARQMRSDTQKIRGL
ncbi:hypothetical protein GCM10010358_76740 [Streptomyces minutiscleroticus]|uniref:Uncharacterized protein n=1 Tax=Streptomyces minutiscleroticus TaxID=68238 RepID=A0A918P1A2_9ACTN|nr:hypothetical protein GCM10010358_76740 [Streptomyces minutiscleroticus]